MRLYLSVWLTLMLSSPAFAFSLNPIRYDEIAGWHAQNHEAALSAFAASCSKGIKPSGAFGDKLDIAAWQKVCSVALKDKPKDSKAFFENHFAPHRVLSDENTKLTGYYIPLLEASLTRSGEYQWPAYRLPDDFKEPYLTRAQISAGALSGKGYELAWVKDPVMLYFMHVQGSGHIRLPDGRVMTLQFAGKNGQPYTSIGRVLIERGDLTRESVSLQTIRRFLHANPHERDAVLNTNASYIFFKLDRSGNMPKGAQGVPLTPMHSLAIDDSIWPYGLPVYLEPINALAITQDTGSAIKGARRGDLFIGLGEEAEQMAGHLNAPQEWVALLPRP